MSEAEKGAATGGKAGGGWTDKERLVYLFALMEQTGAKLDYKNTPRPNGRSEIACQRMVERLKTTIKEELEALKAGQPIGEATPKKRGAKVSNGENVDGTPKSTPKRKSQTNGEVDGEGSPKKRGRPKKVNAEAEIKPDIKSEFKEEEEPENEI